VVTEDYRIRKMNTVLGGKAVATENYTKHDLNGLFPSLATSIAVQQITKH
jgi:hypothetical protein